MEATGALVSFPSLGTVAQIKEIKGLPMEFGEIIFAIFSLLFSHPLFNIQHFSSSSPWTPLLSW
jgi:hypothetical protein